MSDDNKVRIEQDMFDDPIKVKLRGSIAAFGLLCLLAIAMSTCATEVQTRQNKEINQKRLEVAKKQYTLDSLRYEYMKSPQK